MLPTRGRLTMDDYKEASKHALVGEDALPSSEIEAIRNAEYDEENYLLWYTEGHWNAQWSAREVRDIILSVLDEANEKLELMARNMAELRDAQAEQRGYWLKTKLDEAKVDVRDICATNKQLREESTRFRMQIKELERCKCGRLHIIECPDCD